MILNSTLWEVLQQGNMGHLPLLNSFPSCRFRISRFLPFKGIDKPGHWVVMVTHSNQLQLLRLSPQSCLAYLCVWMFLQNTGTCDIRTVELDGGVSEWWRGVGEGGWVIVSFFQTDQNYSLQIKLLLVASCDIYATLKANNILFLLFLLLFDSTGQLPRCPWWQEISLFRGYVHAWLHFTGVHSFRLNEICSGKGLALGIL